MVHLVFKYSLIFFVIILLNSCKNKSTENTEEEFTSCNAIDSLQNVGYEITKKINYFELLPYSSNINCDNDTNLYAVKRSTDTISILEFSNNNIYENRLLTKYSDNFFIEKQVTENKEVGETDFVTIYYSNKKIIITIITNNNFSDNATRSYLKDVFIIDTNFVTNYTYIFNSDLHIQDHNILLTEKQLIELDDNNAKAMFFNKNNVKKYIYVNKDFAKEDTHIYQYFLLPNIKGAKASDVFR